MILMIIIMSRVVIPRMSLEQSYDHQGSSSWSDWVCCCGEEGCWWWSCDDRVVVDPASPVHGDRVSPFPWAVLQGLLAGIACWQPQLVPWPVVLEGHSLVFGDGRLPLHSHKQGLWFLHWPHKPCCSLHQLFETQAGPAKKKKWFDQLFVGQILDLTEENVSEPNS